VAVATTLDLDVLARIGRALADPSRRRVLVELLDGPRYSGDLAALCDGTVANASNHLACLKDCGLVVAHSEGRRVSYELANPALARALRTLGALDLTAICECHRD
jgi:DNA-binding transcriptional ArsR family regulator